MKKRMVKICGITDLSTALAAAQAGADFLGLVFDPHSRRVIDIKEARAISLALASTSTQPVAVFTEHSAAEMAAICAATEIQTVQLHGEKSRKEHLFLDNKIVRIYVHPFLNQEMKDPKCCHPDRDYLLFDAPHPGKGIPFDWNQLEYHGKYQWFLAGGLTAQNLKNLSLQPHGLDVSSGVEKILGKKDLNLIKSFIKEVHHYE